MELEGGDNSGDEVDGAQTTGSMIRYRYDGKKRAEEGHQQLMVKAEFLYVDDCMVAYTDPGWLQSAFDMLMEIFDQMGLRTNIHKTVGMVCRTF